MDPASLRVNLVLVLLNMVTLKWEDVPDGIVNPSHENIGEADVEIATFTVEGVQPISIQIRIDLGSVRRKRVPDLPSLENVILWSPTLYYSMDDKLRSMCSEWADAQPADIGEQILGSVLPCAPTLEQARFPNSGLIEDTDIDIDLYHKGTDVCFRTIFPRYIIIPIIINMHASMHVNNIIYIHACMQALHASVSMIMHAIAIYIMYLQRRRLWTAMLL